MSPQDKDKAEFEAKARQYIRATARFLANYEGAAKEGARMLFDFLGEPMPKDKKGD